MPKTIKVLIVEDNPDDADMVLHQLKRDGYDPIWERVEDAAAFKERLNPSIQLILSDYQLPQFTGLEALDILNASGLNIPFILISGTIGEDLAVKAMKAGASDYLLKDRMVRLGLAVEHSLDTARLRLQQRQAFAELQLFRSLFDNSTDSLEVLCALTGQYLDVNARGHLDLGYTRSEFLALKIFDVDPSIDANIWEQMVKKMRSGTGNGGESRHRRKDGSTFPVEFNAKWVSLDREYVVAVVRDITQRKELEARFFRAQRLEAIGSLASGIAHDMNNILAPILMSAPLLRLGLSAEEVDQTLSTIETSAQRGSDLVKQLLTFGRGVEGARSLVRPELLVRELTSISQQTFPKNIRVTGESEKGLWPIIGDSTQLHQVLLNLSVNARDAMPDGGLLAITAQNVTFDEHTARETMGARPGPYLLLKVVDTGMGIPPDIMDKIFDPFFTTKEVGKGTGLGLSTVIGIVKSHAGFLSLKSEVGKGTTFEIYLPASPKGLGSDPSEGAAAAPRGEGELILIVDDEKNIRDTIRDLLVKYGYQVITAADGAEATVEYARHGKDIKVVITDLEMPIMNGVTLVQVLKKMNPSLVAIVSSGIASMEGMEQRKKELDVLGVRQILTKPYTVVDILHALDKIRKESKRRP
jgi:two-component system, cell cycle sensor histidine kinase and response regulator CckA